MTTELTTIEMLADLTITFPNLWKRPLAEFGGDYAGRPGIWTGADTGHKMPDGDAIFNTLADGTEQPYANPPMHAGFETWLANRGWTWENFDGATIFLMPLSDCSEPAEVTA